MQDIGCDKCIQVMLKIVPYDVMNTSAFCEFDHRLIPHMFGSFKKLQYCNNAIIYYAKI